MEIVYIGCESLIFVEVDDQTRISVFSTVRRLREERICMVQTQVIKEYLNDKLRRNNMS